MTTEPKAIVTIGRRYTKRKRSVFETEFGEFWLEEIHADAVPRVQQRKADAIRRLEAEGIPARHLLQLDDGGTLLVERVIHIDEHTPDSPAGLAALVCRACCQLERIGQVFGKNPRMVAAAFDLGRLAVLQRAYEAGKESRRANAKRPRPNRRAGDHDEIVADFLRLVKQGHTEREARGMLARRGDASPSTIYRVTKNKTVQ